MLGKEVQSALCNWAVRPLHPPAGNACEMQLEVRLTPHFQPWFVFLHLCLLRCVCELAVIVRASSNGE